MHRVMCIYICTYKYTYKGEGIDWRPNSVSYRPRDTRWVIWGRKMNCRRDPNSSIEISTSRLLQGISEVFRGVLTRMDHMDFNFTLAPLITSNDTRRLACFCPKICGIVWNFLRSERNWPYILIQS